MYLPSRLLATPLKVLIASLAALLLISACGRSGRGAAGAASTDSPTLARGTQNPSFDATPLYRQMGMIARGLPFPIVGRAAFAATGSEDSTHVVLALAFSNAALSFAREADNRFRASYQVSVVLAKDNAVVTRTDASEQVLVAVFRETTRTDESVIHQEILDVTPGRYTLTVSIRDEGSQRSAQEQITIEVPRLADGTLSTPMPVAEVTRRDSRLELPVVLMSPSGTAVAGRDSILPIYLEGYGAATTPIRLLVRNEQGRVLWNDTVSVTQSGELASGIVEVPVSRIGIGVARLTFVREGSTDSSSTYVFVGFGGELPVATYDEMLNYLRYFAAPYRLQALREEAAERRPEAWAEFVRETDSSPGTPVHEDLRLYFERVVRANGRFREEATPGWLSDRGRVFITLGEPDQVVEPQGQDFQRNRQQLWEYQGTNLQLVFYDQTGTGRWRLTQASEVRFEAEFRRRLK